ncbi:hypothetical protein Poli38472_007689 [Pythium oligandrum]|uniref:PDZ domain-containing protein n=1 Tax=Pythium oligandrum TaxID=41045 RepID=A0A8K1CQM6_PYTOL|nr:hypothetical protein Poli38472_007689 [Pythium oligandrum]|eukprot:TMW68017.1 hypothetical protein Poli38472_007689 [Pythium oligandrum]
MANDLDPAYSPTAETLSLPPPALASHKADNLKTTNMLAVNGHADRRRTQSAAELQTDTQRTASPTAASPSPRGSLMASSSRSNSFFAAINANINLLSNGTSSPSQREEVRVVTVVYKDVGPLFMDLYSRADGKGAFVKSFRRRPDGGMGNAEASGQVRVNDMLYSINDLVVTELIFATIIQAAKNATFPCTLVFHSRLPPPQQHLPVSPSNQAENSPAKTATWTTKFGQIMAENGLRRANSFERRNDQPSPVRRPSGAETPPANGNDATNKFRNSITLDKVKNSEGMKNFLRMMGKGRPEEDHDTVEGWLDQLELRPELGDAAWSEGYSATPVIAMTSGGRLIGVHDEDMSEFQLTWYRKTPSQDLIEIKGVRAGCYYPSVDDVDSKLCLRCHSLRFTSLVRVVELPDPVIMDPAVKDTVDVLLEAGAGSFSATLASNEFDSFQIKITEDRVSLIKVSEEEDESGTVVSVEYHAHLQVLVDPTDQLRLTLKVQELGSMLGNRPGDSCDVKKKSQLAGVSCFFLVAQNPQHRDILALLIRQFRARSISKEDEEQAHRDELNLFVDPASSLNGDSTPEGSLDSSSNTRHASFARRFGQNDSAARQSPVQAAVQAHTARLTDLFGLSLDDDEGAKLDNSPVVSSRTARFSNANVTRLSGSGSSLPFGSPSGNDAFLQDRLNAQEKEISMLQEKLASMSVLLKSTEHEKSELTAALVVKDTRIESQQRRIQQVEKANVQLTVQGRELLALRMKLDEETKQHTACQQQLAQAIEARDAAMFVDQSSQTDVLSEMSDIHKEELARHHATIATLESEVEELRRRVEASQSRLMSKEQENLVLVGERNALRSRSQELAKEMKRIVGAHRSIDEVEAQLAERKELITQLAVAKAEAKRAVDEMQEYKDALDGMMKQQGQGDKTNRPLRAMSQNLELQRLVHQLTESLNESKEQMSAMKKINGALMTKLQNQDPDFRGSILESPPMSPQSVTSSIVNPRFSDEEDDSEDDEDNEDEEEEARPYRSTAQDESDDDYGDAVDDSANLG